MRKNRIFGCAASVIAIMLMLCTPALADWSMQNVSIQSKFAKDVSPTNALPEYPRPQMVRADWMNLNGLWDYTYLPSYSTEIPTSGFQKILVPYCVESALSGIGTHYESMAYKRNFTVPSSWAGKRVLLNFEAVDWRCEVYVNGNTVGSHDGGYDPFSFDVTEYVNVGSQNEVSLRVFDPTDRWSVPRGKQVRSPGGIFYTSCSGIWQTVWLEAVNKTYIKDFRLTPNIDEATLRVKANAAGDVDKVSTIKATAYHNGTEVASAQGASGEDIVLSIPNPDLWSPDHPFLYDLKLQLVDTDGKTDDIDSYFGMRKINIARDADGYYRMMLNNEFVFQTGPLDQGYWPESNLTPPTDEAMQYDIVQTKKYGFNMVRKHLKVEPRRWYYWTDKLGLLVWQDMPSMNYGGTKDQGVTNDPQMFTPELTAMVNNLYNTPSIINWVIFNEAGGQHNTKGYVDLVRSLDPTRLIDEASGWTHNGYGDILDVHPYPAPSAPTATRAQATADGEYGGIKLAVDGHLWKGSGWGYASAGSAGEFDSTICSFFNKLAYFKTYKGLSAAVYTQLTDVEIEVNGLMTYDRLVKSDQKKLYAANRRLIESEGVEEEYVLPIANISQQSWRYTTATPSGDWYATDFDDSRWKTGNSGFGGNGLQNMTYGTSWLTSDIWLRKTVNLKLSDEDMNSLKMEIYNDEDVEVYVNGVLAYSATGYLTDYKTVNFSSAAKAALIPNGPNVFAIHVKQTGGGQFIDLGLRVEKAVKEVPVTRVANINMEYTKSSEVSFAVGYSLDPNATEPDKVKSFNRLTFADGEANYIGINDGALLSPKTVQLDLSDLISEVPEGSTVKYFVYVKLQKSGVGEGVIHSCAIVDYTQNVSGVATPIILQPMDVSHEDGTILLEGMTGSDSYNAPRNATISANKVLSWDPPMTTNAVLQGYKIFSDEILQTTVSKSVNSYTIKNPSATYTVAAVYTTGMSKMSNAVSVPMDIDHSVNNARRFNGNGFSVPGVFSKGLSNATIEYWFKPDSLYANSQQVGPGWGSFLIWYDQLGRLSAGFDNLSTKRIQTTSNTIKKGEWYHIAVSVAGSRLNMYVNGAWVRTMNVTGGSGIPPTGEFVFGSNGSMLYGWIDDVRIWKSVRTLQEVQSDMAAPCINPAVETDLLAYYKMDEVVDNGVTKLRDYIANNHASYINTTPTTFAEDTTIMQGVAPEITASVELEDSCVVAGEALKATACINSSVVTWRWSVPKIGFNKTNLKEATIAFPKVGTYDVSLIAYNLDGDSILATKRVEVTAAELPEVDFDVYQPDRSAGAPITLLNKSTGKSTTYKWLLPNSSTDQNQTTFNAVASYASDGKYTVTLIVTNPAGSVSKQKEIEVSSGWRNMSFSVVPNVVLPSETTVFTEESGADSANLVWTVSNDKCRTLILGGTTSFVPTAVGRYDITLTDSESGLSSSMKNALYVCSARSKTGLLFRNNGESLVVPQIFSSKTTKFCVEWWMKPSMVLNAGAMQTNNGVFSISTDAAGKMTVTVNGKSVTSPEGFVIANEWHHYAFTMASSRLWLYRDGELQGSFSPILSCPAWDELVIGGEQNSQAVNIDELRIWGTGIKDDALLSVCNTPIENIADAETNDKLMAYYKFDELSSVAKDETSNGNDAQMIGFEKVVGLNYVKSDGVFSLGVNTPSNLANPEDVSATYLTNYEAEFINTGTKVNESNHGNYLGLQTSTPASTWQGDIMPASESGVYVDATAGGKLTFTTSWEGFADDGVGKKIYEAITLPAGVYIFSAQSAVSDNTDDCMLVVTVGDELAGISQLPGTLASAPLSDGSVMFTLPSEFTVAVGVLYNLPAYSTSQITGFSLAKLPAEIIPASKEGVTAIVSPSKQDSKIDIKVKNGAVQLTGNNEAVSVYTVEGKLVLSTIVRNTITLSLAKGVYIINNTKVRID